jgi:hypothetical protein
MKRNKGTLLHSLKILIGNLLKGRVHFPKEHLGRILTLDNGQEYTVFRHLRVDAEKGTDVPAAVFIVRFKFARFPLLINKGLSLFPIPFLIARPGFQEKMWTINRDGYFQGIYQFASMEFAEAYPLSFVFKAMKRRSATGTLSYEIVSNTCLSGYVDQLSRH